MREVNWKGCFCTWSFGHMEQCNDLLDWAPNSSLVCPTAQRANDVKVTNVQFLSEFCHFSHFTAKVVVWRCAFCKPRRDFGFFCSVNHFSEGVVNANHNVTCSPSSAENDSGLLKNSEGNRDGEWIFCWRKEADVALFLQVSRMRQIIKICEANLTIVDYCPNWGRSQRTNLETRNQQNWSRSTNHESQTMTFWTRASKHVFPKRSAKMIDGTEKPKICKTHSAIQRISL